MTTINNGTPNLGLSGITKRVSAGAEAGQGVAKTTGTGGFNNDSLVRTGSATAAAGSAANAAGTKALDELAAVFDVDQWKFACNLAEKALNDVACLVG